MHLTTSSVGLVAGVIITLAYFVLVGYVVRSLRGTRRVPTVILAVSGMVGALPAILYALYRALNVIA
ncbi:hypothetical protein ACFVHW_00010 [Streptomyces sp. NPDC127110]|uniref:hypothetical protein n=1 Tax=Streptomyces sp. NPDC127110 TaxID=3345362 RepID=UPI0036387E60